MAFDSRSFASGVDVKKWKERKFPPDSLARNQFEYLCLLGCDPKGLLSFLTVAVLASQSRRSIYDVYRVSRSEFVKLPDKFEQIARDLESVNPILAHFLEAKLIDNALSSDDIRSRCRLQIAVYKRAPDLLRLLATHLRWANQWLKDNVGPKRFDSFRQSVLGLLTYVDECTKSPHYQAVADLLDHLSSAEQTTLQSVAEWLPKPGRAGASNKNSSQKLLTSSDALKALYLRSAKYGLRSKSKRPPRG
jgi:hypothetical protein